ncbi:MAG: bifunctional demethylmenaquinone methyltransferase/2-methoxy-6-polyprenyl-1,4-benzoquinol methylase UbiE [Bacteroidales bacterium]|nr:bifunctional demethylmenaquinone methyltransferase/2-methoxy-6-polyprenyl-1,4-benzoquinol methylase UbiE [Bacteroidales bacterium]
MAYDFDKIAIAYDRFNHLSTLGIDRLWRRRTVSRMVDAKHPLQYLDVATGTADLAIDILHKAHPESQLTGIDLSEEMMKIGWQKICADKNIPEADKRIVLKRGDAECLEYPNDSFDRVTVAFGVRNFLHLQQGLNEMYRVLKPCGRLAVLELSYPDNKFLLWCYKIYAFKLLPWVGEHLSHDRAAYEYLPQSILRFPKPESFVPMLQLAGFQKVTHKSFTFGVCRLYVAEK